MKKEEIPFGEIGYIVMKRTYCRRLNENDINSKTEEFEDVINRELDASERQLGVGFTQKEKDEYKKLRMQLKFSVAGRFMWQLGTKTVTKLGLPSLMNCAACVVDQPIRPFTWAMEMLMLGSGVGYTIQREYVYQLPKLKKKIKIERLDTASADFIVPDTREGWVKLLGKVLKAHFYSGEGFTYSTELIRSKGAPIKGFGGTSSGPEELCWGIGEIHKILNNRANQKLRPIDCLDIMNIIGYIVVSGNVRRSAQIAIGDFDDIEYLKAKRWDLGSIPNWRAMSNNSIAPPADLTTLPTEFWDTYQQGEPYGLINFDLIRSCGRLGETQYPDPNVVSINPCVTGDTEILTQKGYKRIDESLDSEIDVWNGFEWSKVIPKITGHNQHLLKVTLSDGRSLTCTDYHKWHISTSYQGGKKVVQTVDLKIGDKIIKYNFPVLYPESDTDITLKKKCYTQGFISADGQDDNNSLWLYEPKFMCRERLDIRNESNDFIINSGLRRREIKFNYDDYKPKDYVPLEWTVNSKLEWLAGLLDGDGCELVEGGVQLCSINPFFLRDVQKLLSLLGVNSKVIDGNEAGYRVLPDGHGGQKEYFCNKIERICIGAVQMQSLVTLGLKCERLKLDKTPQRDASQFVKIVKIEDAGFADTVYCFNEPLRHTGIFNGILTGQCAEQPLDNFETCCLGEIYLSNIESYDELLRCIMFSYRMCKHSLALHCTLKETEEVVHKNMRMGIGVTGYLQATEEQRSWLSDAYVWLRDYDKKYSAKNDFPVSIKLTTCKPSGTLSLLPGVTPGVHPNPAGPYYIRRMRIAANSPLVNVCKQSGYFVEPQKQFDGTDDRSTMVIEFPCKVPETTPVASNFTWKEQIDNVIRLQREWSDNAVSCTVYYRKEDLPELKKYLEENLYHNIKTISFLLQSDHGFKQAPYETITKERYLEMVKGTTRITSVDIKDNEFEIEECLNGSCPIK